MKRAPYCLALTAALLVASSSAAIAQAAAPAPARNAIPNYIPVTTAILENPSPRDWLHMSRTYDQQRFSPLTQVNRNNVGQLKMAWARGLGEGSAQQSTPLVYNGVMFEYAPGDRILALNATNGDLLWAYEPRYDGTGGKTKSLGIFEDKIYFASIDGFVRALNARTGETVWETAMVGRSGNRNSSGGVLVADGKVLMNGACTNLAAADVAMTGRKGCYIVALDARTGQQVWKFYTAPGAGEPGAETWAAHLDPETRNASAWGVPGSYDPELKLTYWGTADPKPYPHLTRYATRPGLHDGVAIAATSPTDLYSNSTLAIDITTGKLKWYFQGLPADSWDADHNQERLLINVVANPSSNFIKWINPNTKTGVERKLVVYNAEGGGQFALDRATGEFVWGRPFPYDVPNANMNRMDPATGRTYINFDLVFKKDGDTSLGCYHNTRNWWVTAYNPQNNSQYLHFDDNCLTMNADARNPNGYSIRNGVMRPGIDPDKYGNLAKVDMTTGEMRILYQSKVPHASATLVTAGGLVFSGDVLGRYRAFNSDTGAILWEGIVGGLISQSNITYEAGGKQYLMIHTGGTGGTGAVSTPGVLQALSTPPVRNHYAVYVFSL